MPTLDIKTIVGLDNLVPELDELTLTQIGSRVVEEYAVDKKSMQDWEERNEVARKLIDQKAEIKTEPWYKAANTKLPLVLHAASRMSAEEYAEILRGKELVKYEMFGKKDDAKQARADRVVKRMNFQYFHELEDWEEDHDKLIQAKNIWGTVHKKYIYCPGKGVECRLRRSGVVINDSVERDAPRITDELQKFWWEAEEKFRSGEWEKIRLTDTEQKEYAQSDKPQEFLEQLRREDLDGDGYPEPYVITVHKSSRQVVSIIPNFTPESIEMDGDEVVRINMSRTRVRYVKYSMVHSYDGGYWDYGFGILLGPLNENCNTLVNQLLDAGRLANSQSGFYSTTLRTKQGGVKVSPGEWKPVQAPGMALKDAFFPIPTREPSSTLFSLLGLLMDVLKELSSVTEVMSGEQPHANMAQGTVMSLIEQGKKVFNSIYKRHYRSLKKEFLALFDLNFIYEDPEAYLRFHDMTIEQLVEASPNLKGAPRSDIAMSLVQGDFERAELDILPTANPEFSSRVQRMAQAQAMLATIENPEVNRVFVLRQYAEGIYDDVDMAKMAVPDDPVRTPQQALQEMEVLKQETLDAAEVRLKQLDEQIKELELEMAKVKLAQTQTEAPTKVATSEYKRDEAELKAIQSAAEIDRAERSETQ